MQGGGGRGPGGHGRARGRADVRHPCGMTVDGLEVVGSILRTIPRPSTAIRQVPPVLLHYSVRNNNSPDGLDLVD